MLVFKYYLYHMFSTLIWFYIIGLWIYIIASYIQFDRNVRWFRFLEALMAPPLRWVRKLTGGRTQFGMIDFSPMVLVLVLPFLLTILSWLLGIR
ncbi:MAG: hypothetical protein CR997_01430 [Acidobacteria bacterium]|nr:MAG: hypothetical protein CR997_01430 [Acidobacteriota bacterium]